MVQASQPQPKIDGLYADRQPKTRPGLQRIQNMTQSELIEAANDPARLEDLIEQIKAMG